MNLRELKEQHGGTLPAFAWPGGYPIIYYFADGMPCCPACANGANGSEASIGDAGDYQWSLRSHGVHWEGPPETCAHCGSQIESAYGNPDNGEVTES